MFWVLGKYWPAFWVLCIGLPRAMFAEDDSYVEIPRLGAAGLGVVMNLTVVLANGGMPVATTAEMITDDERPLYKPIDENTRLRFLSDWIDVGGAYFSPGDFLIYFAVAGLVIQMIVQAVV
jgi:hypothetical protein